MTASIVDILNQNAEHVAYTPVDLKPWLGESLTVDVKRYDLLDAYVSGNKWFKLKYNLIAFFNSGKKCLVSFGGPFSNHLLALAYICNRLKITCYGIVRGEPQQYNQAPLAKLLELGMQVIFVPRNAYKRKESDAYIQSILAQIHDTYFLIPEGGSNAFALRGVADMVCANDLQTYSHILLCCGTGCTLAGIIAAYPQKMNVFIGVSVLKGDFMLVEIQKLWSENGIAIPNQDKIHIWDDAHLGGYAKSNPKLDLFTLDFYNHTGIEIEPVYSGKLFWSLIDKLKKNVFSPKGRILVLHTGGVHPK